MAGKRIPYRSVPFFWTNQVGLYFRYVGYAKEWDDIIVLVQRDVSSTAFTAYYVKDNRVIAAAGNDTEKEMAAIEELIRLNQCPIQRNSKLNLSASWLGLRKETKSLVRISFSATGKRRTAPHNPLIPVQCRFAFKAERIGEELLVRSSSPEPHFKNF